ncbi:MAG: EAL domain-containing protein [Burkholderiales bacterium]
MPPSLFIPVAEEIGLISVIGDWVLRTACLQGMEWRSRGVLPIRIAVNVSPRSFWDSEFPANVARVLAETGWPADLLCLEITESTIMNRDDPNKILRQLSAMGVKLAIDDFGVGYSSLSYLQHFSVDYLKIDRCFTSGIPDDASNLAITRAIIALAKNLGLQVIAEGVENQAQLQALEDEGCDEAQGYFFSRPVTTAAIEHLLRKGVLVERSNLRVE